MQNEKPDSVDSGLVAFIRSLNVGTVGNSGLIETLGQEIIDVNLESIEMAPEMVQALQKKKLVEEEMAAEVLESLQKVEIANNRAQEIIALGDAENKVTKGRLEAVGGVDGLVGMAKWKALNDLKDLKGTLILGDNGTRPVIQLPVQNNNEGGGT
jgi:regulator of protease activity HflC (stomatin/prohibitin superfamily)